MYPFDFNKWASEFSPFTVAAHSKRQGYSLETVSHISSPVHLVIAERLRDEVADVLSATRTVPCDIFVWALGEPDDRSVTKIGGLPYRPAGQPWPAKDGLPYTFLAQFDFSASRDLVGATPGDILLVFTLHDDFDDLHFEWQQKGITDLVVAASIPDPCFKFVTCYGESHRTVDYPDGFRAIGKFLMTRDFEDRERYGTFDMCVLNGTKIGGAPCFGGVSVWDENQNKLVSVTNLDELVAGRYLCSLGPVQPNPFFEYPFTNSRKCLSLKHYRERDKTLILVDMGSIFIYLTEDGGINHRLQYS